MLPSHTIDTLIGPGGRNHKMLQQRMRCIIHVGQERIPWRIDLKGDYKHGNTFDSFLAVNELIKVLLPLVSTHQESTLLYELAHKNGHERHHKFVRLYFRNELQWFGKLQFPTNFREFSGLFVGRKGSGIQPILHVTKCQMDMQANQAVVYGVHLGSVERCMEMLEKHLRFAEKRFYES